MFWTHVLDILKFIGIGVWSILGLVGLIVVIGSLGYKPKWIARGGC